MPLPTIRERTVQAVVDEAVGVNSEEVIVVARISLGEMGFCSTSPATRSVLPTILPRANPPPAKIAA
jgi:hypothetical protein